VRLAGWTGSKSTISRTLVSPGQIRIALHATSLNYHERLMAADVAHDNVLYQPRNRAVGDIVGSGNVAHRLASVAAAERLLDLMRRHFKRTPHFHAARLGAGATFAGASTDQLALELS
jgi:hypothetical protein